MYESNPGNEWCIVESREEALALAEAMGSLFEILITRQILTAGEANSIARQALDKRAPAVAREIRAGIERGHDQLRGGG